MIKVNPRFPSLRQEIKYRSTNLKGDKHYLKKVISLNVSQAISSICIILREAFHVGKRLDLFSIQIQVTIGKLMNILLNKGVRGKVEVNQR